MGNSFYCGHIVYGLDSVWNCLTSENRCFCPFFHNFQLIFCLSLPSLILELSERVYDDMELYLSLSLSWPAKVKAQISGMTLQKILPKQDKQDRMRTGGLHSGVGWVIHAKVEKYEHNEYYDWKSNTNEEAFKDVYHAADVTVLMMHGRKRLHEGWCRF